MTTATSISSAPDLRRLAHYASLAPSSHNTQPWRFEVRAGRIDLLADRTRALPVNDPEDRELTISCGAALFNLRVAAAHLGLRGDVRLLPDAGDGDHLATVDLSPGEASQEERRLFPALERRRTHRQRFDERAVDAVSLAALVTAAEREGAWLEVLESDEKRAEAAALVARGDAEQWSDPRWRRELAMWMHPRRRGDGLSVPSLAVPLTQLVVRTFDMGGGVGAKDEELAKSSPVLAVVGTAGDTVLDWLHAGQALERVLLEGVTRGLQASYLNQPIQVASLRPQLARVASRPGAPQLLLRLGYASSELRATPRRPVSAFVSGG